MRLLWIDFKLYFYVSNHMNYHTKMQWTTVVNWFQIVFLCEQSHEFTRYRKGCFSCELISNCIFMWAITWSQNVTWLYWCCELISNCIFMWAITCNGLTNLHNNPLWIDFKLYFYVSNHMVDESHCLGAFVVNWFQIVFLCEQSHV